LKGTTEKGGTGEGAVPAGYEIAGKTGTAQKADGSTRGYAEDLYNSGFMGFAPADDPKIALLVIIEEPQGATYGGIVAAPVFRAIMEKVLPYLNVHPKGTVIVKDELNRLAPRKSTKPESLVEEVKVRKREGAEVMPDLTGLSIRSALSRIEGKGLIIKVSGNGRVVEQSPQPGAVIERGDICWIKLQSSS
jgi:cell division protein FtsI (penicillin-binding protein 3)